jgi:hypothetical protein
MLSHGLNFFMALIRKSDMNFDSLEKSRAAVDIVTLANNGLAIYRCYGPLADVPQPQESGPVKQ